MWNDDTSKQQRRRPTAHNRTNKPANQQRTRRTRFGVAQWMGFNFGIRGFHLERLFDTEPVFRHLANRLRTAVMAIERPDVGKGEEGDAD